MNLPPRLNYRSVLCCILTAVLLWLPGQACALGVESIRFGKHENAVRMVLDLSESASFRIFLLGDPYRMVIDLPSFEWRVGTIGKPGNAAITNIRQGPLQPGISRIVIDLARPVAIRSAFLLPGTKDRPDRLVVDYEETPVAAFRQDINRIHGTLGERPMVPPAAAPGAFENAAATTAAVPARKPAGPESGLPPAQRPLIIIDPGHGGVDPGAPGANGIFEKNVTLALGKELRRQLEATGRYRVKMTRETDTFIPLKERVQFARRNNADLFISLHADSMGGKSDVRGASIYSLSEKASDAQTARLADRENRSDLIAGIDLSSEDQDVVSILVDLAMRETMNQSKFFANTIVNNLSADGVRLLEKPHRSAGFAVLKAPDIPSILIETGFMSNKAEANMLMQDSYRQKLAAALVSGVDAYFRKVRNHRKS